MFALRIAIWRLNMWMNQGWKSILLKPSIIAPMNPIMSLQVRLFQKFQGTFLIPINYRRMQKGIFLEAKRQWPTSIKKHQRTSQRYPWKIPRFMNRIHGKPRIILNKQSQKKEKYWLTRISSLRAAVCLGKSILVKRVLIQSATT